MHTVTILGEHSSYTMMAKPIRALQLHYLMIQFLINNNALSSEAGYFLLLLYGCISCAKVATNISSLTNLGHGCIVLVV